MNRMTLPMAIITGSLIIAAAILFRVDTKSELTMEAKAEVTGRNYRDFQRDSDFRKRVQNIIENNCTVSGHVDGEYFYNAKIACN
jgi:hypothetical protein